METTNNAQKTENRKFESPSMKTLAVVISLVLFSFAAGANEFWKHANENNSSEIITASNAILLETSVEKNLEIENWMTNEKYFGAQMSGIEEEMEESLSIEDWMLTNQNFIETTDNTENDTALKVEDWMLDSSLWGN